MHTTCFKSWEFDKKAPTDFLSRASSSKNVNYNVGFVPSISFIGSDRVISTFFDDTANTLTAAGDPYELVFTSYDHLINSCSLAEMNPSTLAVSICQEDELDYMIENVPTNEQ